VINKIESCLKKHDTYLSKQEIEALEGFKRELKKIGTQKDGIINSFKEGQNPGKINDILTLTNEVHQADLYVGTNVPKTINTRVNNINRKFANMSTPEKIMLDFKRKINAVFKRDDAASDDIKNVTPKP
jgi:hypothetical protein